MISAEAENSASLTYILRFHFLVVVVIVSTPSPHNVVVSAGFYMNAPKRTIMAVI
jgi:hypothetical protein